MTGTDYSYIKKFTRGEVIIGEGSGSPRCMVVVMQGQAAVYKNYKRENEVFVKKIDPGGFHSVYSLFLNHEQAETIIALTDVTVSFISKKIAAAFFSKHGDIAVNVIESVCRDAAGNAHAEPPATEEHNEPEENSTSVAAPKIPEEPKEPEALSGGSKLFPDGHGSYTLPLTNGNEQLVYCVKTTCPICKSTFDNLGVFISRLRKKSTDPDSRERFVGVEPIYYELITCPNCLLSANFRTFPEVSGSVADRINEKVGRFISETEIKTGRSRDTFTVFAGYYLALLCAPVLYTDYQVKTGGLWLKLSRLYSDCGASDMEKLALEQAFEDFNFAYMKLRLPESQGQQICYMLGELHCKAGRYEEARNCFYTVKTNKAANEAIRRQSDRRLDEVRELMTRKTPEQTEINKPEAPTKEKKSFFHKLKS